MVKEFVVKYGNYTYKRNALTGESQDYLGLRLLPKVIGFGTTINAMISRKDVPNENHYTIYQCFKDIFVSCLYNCICYCNILFCC